MMIVCAWVSYLIPVSESLWDSHHICICIVYMTVQYKKADLWNGSFIKEIHSLR